MLIKNLESALFGIKFFTEFVNLIYVFCLCLTSKN